MLGKLPFLSSLVPSDPLDIVLDFIEGEEVTIAVGDKLVLRFTISKTDEQRLEDGRKKTKYSFTGELTRRG